ncbi:hypothetical protein GWK16_06405 [Roseomonas sp. JC162]|uniref:Uncharacterized protein n=1 Tax=Neoroseomonas marina TaxID=1232220 RepID=A0A848EC50_9PROT|nr:tripartite tricarboxylate transporter substrate-binding protein [Neoroseomonas marina]NMJ40865.1 hypothetical protein [Neoroseomonas marina]
MLNGGSIASRGCRIATDTENRGSLRRHDAVRCIWQWRHGVHPAGAANALSQRGKRGAHRSVHEAGQVRILAISGTERHPGLPNVPTVREQGFDWSVMSFNAVTAPAGIPPDRRQLLETPSAR